MDGTSGADRIQRKKDTSVRSVRFSNGHLWAAMRIRINNFGLTTDNSPKKTCGNKKCPGK